MLEDQAFDVPSPGVLGNDSAGDGASPCIVNPPTTSDRGGEVSVAPDGAFTYHPPANYAGPDSFSYGVAGAADGADCPTSADDTAVVDINVTPVNDKPTIDLLEACEGGVTVAEDAGTYLGQGVCATLDPGPANEDAQEVAGWGIDVGGDVAFSTGPTITDEGFLQFKPAANDFGTATIRIRGRDDGGTANGGKDLSGALQLVITVTPVADAPTASADAFGGLMGRTLNIAAPGVLANDSDPDGEPLAAVLVTGPTHGVLTLAANGSFSYTPASGYIGADAFSYQASDGELSSTARVVSLNVSAVPAPAPTPTAVVTPPPSTDQPSLEPSRGASAAPTFEPSPSSGPGGSAPATPIMPTASVDSAASPEPAPTGGGRGLSLPLLLVTVLLGVLLTFAGAYSVPRLLRSRERRPLDPE